MELCFFSLMTLKSLMFDYSNLQAPSLSNRWMSLIKPVFILFRIYSGRRESTIFVLNLSGLVGLCGCILSNVQSVLFF